MKIEELFEKAKNNPKDVRYTDLCRLCDHYFGEPRQKATSHRVYKTRWRENPRINIQEGMNGKAKAYQVKQVIAAIERLMNP